MSKPTELPEWNTNETNLVEPDASYKSDGWTIGEAADSSFFNWYMNRAYQWLAWLDAGEWEAVNLDLSGALTVDGDVTSGGDVEADNLYFTSTETTQLDIHGTNYGSFGTTASGYVESTAGSQIHDVVIELPLGAQIWGYSFRCYGNGTDSLTRKLVKITDGVEVDVDALVMLAVSAAWQTVSVNFAPEEVTLGTRYVIRFTAGGSGQRVAAPTVDWTNPKP